jgi:hypothetical protein
MIMNTQATTADNIEPAPRRMSVWKIMAKVYTEPKEASRQLASKPRIVVPVLLIILAMYGQLFATNGIRLDSWAAQIRKNPELTQEQIQYSLSQIEAQKGGGVNWLQALYGLGFVAIAKLAQILPSAFVLWLALQFSVKRPRFLPVLMVVVMAFMVAIPEAVLTTLMMIAKGSTDVSFGLALLVPSELKSSPLNNMLMQIDVFSIWALALLIMGLPIMTGVTRRFAAITVGYVWAIWLLFTLVVGRPIQIA